MVPKQNTLVSFNLSRSLRLGQKLKATYFPELLKKKGVDYSDEKNWP